MKQKAEQIISHLKGFVENLNGNSDGPDVGEKRKQLKAVEKSIKQMQRSSVTIPSEIRNLKTKLINDLSQADQADSTLSYLASQLMPIMKDLGVTVTKHRSSSGPVKRATGPKTDQPVLRQYIIKALKAHGGKATMKTALDWMEKDLDGKLTPRDLSTRKHGEIVWRNNAAWERHLMVKAGILKSGSPRGIWELNEECL